MNERLTLETELERDAKKVGAKLQGFWGTSSVAHLRDNVTGAALTLSEDELTELNGIAS